VFKEEAEIKNRIVNAVFDNFSVTSLGLFVVPRAVTCKEFAMGVREYRTPRVIVLRPMIDSIALKLIRHYVWVWVQFVLNLRSPTVTVDKKMKSTVRVQREHRVAIPPPIRETLDLERGDVVEIDVRPVGEVNEDG
jgi:hypothetical protein